MLPFLPPLEEKTLSQYYWIYGGLVAAIITFGGLASPILEVKLGLGGEGLYLKVKVKMWLVREGGGRWGIRGRETGGAGDGEGTCA